MVRRATEQAWVRPGRVKVEHACGHRCALLEAAGDGDGRCLLVASREDRAGEGSGAGGGRVWAGLATATATINAD